MESNEATMKEEATTTYRTLSQYHLDLVVWEKMKNLYEAVGEKAPPKPVWNPSKDYKEYD
jgi:hypothetical protein